MDCHLAHIKSQLQCWTFDSVTDWNKRRQLAIVAVQTSQTARRVVDSAANWPTALLGLKRTLWPICVQLIKVGLQLILMVKHQVREYYTLTHISHWNSLVICIGLQRSNAYFKLVVFTYIILHFHQPAYISITSIHQSLVMTTPLPWDNGICTVIGLGRIVFISLVLISLMSWVVIGMCTVSIQLMTP